METHLFSLFFHIRNFSLLFLVLVFIPFHQLGIIYFAVQAFHFNTFPLSYIWETHTQRLSSPCTISYLIVWYYSRPKLRRITRRNAIHKLKPGSARLSLECNREQTTGALSRHFWVPVSALRSVCVWGLFAAVNCTIMASCSFRPVNGTDARHSGIAAAFTQVSPLLLGRDGKLCYYDFDVREKSVTKR